MMLNPIILAGRVGNRCCIKSGTTDIRSGLGRRIFQSSFSSDVRSGSGETDLTGAGIASRGDGSSDDSKYVPPPRRVCKETPSTLLKFPKGFLSLKHLRKLKRNTDYTMMEESFEVNTGVRDTPFVFGDGRDTHATRYDEERLESMEAKRQLLEEVLREDVGGFDTSGSTFIARAFSTDGGSATYEYGCGPQLRAPKILHHGMTGNKRKSVTTKHLKQAVNDMREVPDSEHEVKPFNEEIPINVSKSTLMLYEGERVPDFQNPPQLDKDDADPIDVSWNAINFSKKARRPIRCRVLKQVSSGYIIAVGAVIGFLPNSQVLPQRVMSGKSLKYDDVSSIILGEQIWVMVLNADQKMSNLVVSHRLVPIQYAFKKLSSTKKLNRRDEE